MNSLQPNLPSSAVVNNPLLTLGTYVARHQVAIAFATDPVEISLARGSIAGILAAAKVLLPDRTFRQFVIGNEIDPPTLDYLLAIATAEPDLREFLDQDPNHHPIIET